MARVINFSAGPAMLPESVIRRMQDELPDYAGTGMSILEHSHRSDTYGQLQADVLRLLRDIAAIPDDFETLILPGGASLQFALVPMNVLFEQRAADYVISGRWAKKAYEEATAARRPARIAASSEEANYRTLPVNLDVDPRARYVHLCLNNTVAGTQWPDLPDTAGVPLVVDATSEFLSRPVDWSRIELLYAGTQKNLGIAGATIVVIRRDSLESHRRDLPRILSYAAYAEAGSLINTPPVAAVYAMRLVLEWLRDLGGIPAAQALAAERATLVYGAVDAHPAVYDPLVRLDHRSQLNAVFGLRDTALTDRMLAEAADHGFRNLAGHRSAGGLRASMYNAMPVDAVKRFADFVHDFAKRHGD